MEEPLSTKQQIFLAAAELFSDHGYDDVTMRNIADKVGISAPSIYHHYPSKDKILLDILNNFKNRLASFYTGDNKPQVAGTLPDSIQNLVLTYNPDELQLMLWTSRILFSEQYTSPLATDVLLNVGVKQYEAYLEDFLNNLTDCGLLKSRKNNRFYANMLSRVSLTYSIQFTHPGSYAVWDMEKAFYNIGKMIEAYETLAEEQESL